MSDVSIRVTGCAGRITLTRPAALNALTYRMVRDIAVAMDAWETDPAVAVVVIDAAGDRAFCAGGDIAEMFATATAGDFAYGRRFWADEYRLNARLATFAKPIVTFLQGFTMGGGVGIGCHASHRVVGQSSRIAMPECGIGLVPDVGGSLILATAPGRLGEYLGLTGTRMGPGDAVFAGFADMIVDEARWPALIAALEAEGDLSVLAAAREPVPEGALAGLCDAVSSVFGAASTAEIAAALAASGDAWAQAALQAMGRNSPLSMACALEIVRRVRRDPTIRAALTEEYRFTWRSAEQGDFIEGIRAQIIDKDRNPRWRHGAIGAVTQDEVARMLAPLEIRLWEDDA